MNFHDEHAAIAGRFLAGWTAGAYASTPIAWPNEEFTPPDAAPYVTFVLLTGEGLRKTLGLEGWWAEWAGIIQNSVFAPLGSGTSDLHRIAHAAAQIWQQTPGLRIPYEDGVVHLETSEITPIRYEGAWARVEVSTNYRRQHFVRSA